MQVLNRFNDIAMGARFIVVTMPKNALLKDGEVAMKSGLPSVGGDFDPFKEADYVLTADDLAAANLQLLMQTLSSAYTQPVLAKVAADGKSAAFLLARDYKGVHLDTDFYRDEQAGFIAHANYLLGAVKFYNCSAIEESASEPAEVVPTLDGATVAEIKEFALDEDESASN